MCRRSISYDARFLAGALLGFSDPCSANPPCDLLLPQSVAMTGHAVAGLHRFLGKLPLQLTLLQSLVM
jgi:hypothetical protein